MSSKMKKNNELEECNPGNLISEDARSRTLGWLESNQISGAFDGHDEEKMDFSKLSDAEIRWYFVEWVSPQILEENDEDDSELIKEIKLLLGRIYTEEEVKSELIRRGYKFAVLNESEEVIELAVKILNLKIVSETDIDGGLLFSGSHQEEMQKDIDMQKTEEYITYW